MLCNHYKGFSKFPSLISALLGMLAVSLLTSVVTACVTQESVFYKPSSALGKVHNFSHSGNGPPDGLYFWRNKIWFAVHIFIRNPEGINRSDYLEAVVQMRVPSYTNFHFALEKLHVINMHDIIVGPSGYGVIVEKYDLFPVMESGSATGPTVRLKPPVKFSTNSHGVMYFVYFEIKIMSSKIYPNALYIILPEMRINGKHYASVRIEFKRTKGTYTLLPTM